MRIGILAPAQSRQARQIQDAVEALAPGTTVPLSLDLGPSQRVALDGTAVTWNGERLDGFDALYVHGFRYEDPVLPPESADEDWSFWSCGHVVRQQTYSFLYSVLSRLEAGGPRLYNGPAGHLAAFARHRPLDRLHNAGVAAAPVTLTNEDAVAVALQERHPVIVWRPVTGRAAWQVFRDKQRRAVVGPDKPPVLLAPVAEGPLVRAVVANGRLLALWSMAGPAREGLERFEALRPLDPSTVPHADRLAAVPGRLDLRWATITAVAAADGPVVYDVDPDPVLTGLPEGLAAHVARGLAHALLDRPAPADPLPAGGERSTLLLRRMLAIQFDMEATKHVDVN